MKIRQFFNDLSKFTAQLRYLFAAIWNGEIVFHEDGRVGCRDLAIGIKPEQPVDDSVIDYVEIVRTNEPQPRAEPERRAIEGNVDSGR